MLKYKIPQIVTLTLKIHMMEKCKSDTKKLYCNGKDMQRYQAAEHANLTSPANTL